MRNTADNTKPKTPYWAASDILWPPGFTCIGRKTGTLAHGETWVVRDDITEALCELEKKKAKTEAGINFVERKIAELEEALAQRNETEDGALDEVEALLHAQHAETYDPYAEDEVYGYREDNEDDDNGVLSTSAYRPQSPLNVHNYEDPEAALEEKNRIRTALEDTRDELIQEIEALQRNMFRVTWGAKAIPAQLARIDAPWLQFAENQQREQQQNTAATKPKAKPNRSSRSEDKKRNAKDKKSTPQATDESDTESSAKKNREFCAKLLSAGIQEAADGRKFLSSSAVNDTSAIRPLLLEGEELLRQQWRVIITLGNGDFEAVRLLPLVAVLDVQHSHHASLRDAAFFSPLCVHGSVVDAVNRVAGKRREYWFKDSLILENLKTTVRSLALLERAGIVHGSVKPSNVYISSDGSSLLVGDFLPQTELKRWFSDLGKKLSNPPDYFSPEMYQLLMVKQCRHFSSIQNQVNLHKHDVFCLGLTYYYITSRLEPKGFHRDKKRLDHALQQLRATKLDPELLEYLSKMLTFDAASRPSFWDMLNFTEKAAVAGQSLLSGIKALFGISNTNEETLAEISETGPKSDIINKARDSPSSSKGGCTIQ